MAVRLVRWLGKRSHEAGIEPTSLAAAAAEHLCDGGFVDWARLSLRSGDPVQVLSEAYARLFEAVTQIRETQAHAFARLLADWTDAGSQGSDLVPVERVLAEIVAPLAADSPVLVIVIDGMTVAVCRELLADLTRHEWVALCEAGRSFNRPGIAMVPSVTEFSRTSLLTGRLQAGGAAEERTGFAEHPALVARCRSGTSPNLDVRLQRYCTLLGRRSALWHGDVTTTARRHVLRDPPDCLLTTPESLELMLVSPNVDARGLFSNLRAVIVDEIHAFAGDDRGWHLLSVLSRITRIAGRELQRIGLSATVGNPELLIEWLTGSCAGPRTVYQPAQVTDAQAEVKLDYVGSLKNAAVVISRLHRGEKRLVFVDSRARAEELGAELRQLNVTAFVTHSSLSQEQRRQAEDAFANRDDCVIVATSVLELGVDVGNLDRVIQIDSPTTVSSFLQRMGRTGRRQGGVRNCLFLATEDNTLVQAAGLIDLWHEGCVEPIQPPPEPYHVLAQQLMALVLQERGIGRHTWLEWVGRVPTYADMQRERIHEVVEWMLTQGMLWEDQGILGIGQKGEETYGRRHFLELLSVFLSPPMFAVLHGRQELGFVDEMTFLGKRDGARVLLLGGRAWHVVHIDWQRKIAHVEASEAPGRTRWKGTGRGLSFRLSQAIRRVFL